MLDEFYEEMRARYGDEKGNAIFADARRRYNERLHSFKNIKENEYKIEDDQIIIELPKVGKVDTAIPAASAAIGIALRFVIKEASKRFAKDVIKQVGNHDVILDAESASKLFFYEAGNALIDAGDISYVGESSLFAKEQFSSKKEHAKILTKHLKDLSGSGGRNIDPGDFEPGDRKGKNKIDDSEFQRAKSEGKIEYKDADYHHQQSQGMKSPSPKSEKDAIEALKNSVKVSENTDRRIGVDVKNKEFVVFDKTIKKHDGSIEYHGHVRDWNKLHHDQQRVLRNAEMVDRKGNINPNFAKKP